MWISTQTTYAGRLGKEAILSKPSLWLHRCCEDNEEKEEYSRCTSNQAEALRILVEEWNLQNVQLSALPSYDDSNWKVVTNEAIYVLKIASAGAECRGKCDAQTTILALDCEGKIMEKLGPELAPRVIKTKNGQITARLGDSRFARLSSWIQGETFSKFRNSPDRQSLLTNVGVLLAQVLSKLEDFDDFGISSARPLSWDLRNATSVSSYLSLVKDIHQQQLARKCLARVQPALEKLKDLPCQVIHGDLNDENLLVLPDGTLGLIDFGDFCRAPRIVEIAICLAYILFFSPENDQVFTELRTILLAFNNKSSKPLNETELEVLLPLIAARNCQTVLTAQYRLSLTPHDSYVAISAEPAWRLMAKIDTIISTFSSQKSNGQSSISSYLLPTSPQQNTRRDFNKEDTNKPNGPSSSSQRSIAVEEKGEKNDAMPPGKNHSNKDPLLLKLGASAAVATAGLLVTIFLSRRRGGSRAS